MKFLARFLGSFLVAVLVAGGSSAQTEKETSSTGKFKYKSGKSDIGMLYQFERTTLDFAKTGTVLVYVVSKTQVQLLRTEVGVPTATSAVIEMSWDNASVKQVDLYTEKKGAPKARAATSVLTERRLETKVDDPQLLYKGGTGAATSSLFVPHLPAHTVTLDFATLAVALRYISDPDKEFDLGVIGTSDDPAKGPYGYKGKVNVKFVEDVDRDGVTCRKYRVSGAGLGAKEGFLWASKANGQLQDMEMPLSPEPGWADFRMSLKSAAKASESDFEKKKAEELAAAFK